MGSGFAIGYGTALLMRPRVYYVQRPHNYQEIVKEKPLRCATTNTSVIFSKADYEGQDIDVKEDEVQCQVLHHHHPIGSLLESTKCPNHRCAKGDLRVDGLRKKLCDALFLFSLKHKQCSLLSLF